LPAAWRLDIPPDLSLINLKNRFCLRGPTRRVGVPSGTTSNERLTRCGGAISGGGDGDRSGGGGSGGGEVADADPEAEGGGEGIIMAA